MFRKVLLPVDGSTFAEHALPYAAQAARDAGAELILTLVHVRTTPATTNLVLRDEIEEWESSHAEREMAYLNELVERAVREYGLAITPRLLSGDVVPTLEREVEQQQIDLVVMTTHGRAGLERAWLGSVADALVRHVDVPVLLVRPSDDEPLGRDDATGYRHVLVALDGSERAERCIAPALALAGDAAAVTLLRVVSPPAAVASPYLPHAVRLTHDEQERRLAEAEAYLAEQRPAAAARAGTVRTAVLNDYHPARAILGFAAEHGVDLIALGTHGRAPVTRLVMGSVSDKVARAAAVPVLIC
jgi:nucleotide-binding universal stress UspA family protein